MPGEEPRWDVDFWVDDLDATAAKRAAELGGTVLTPPADDADRAHAPSSPTRRARPFSVSRVVPA